jgi:hypothetical protein
MYLYKLLTKRRAKLMSDYIFKMKKGEIEIELKSDDPKFIEEQLDKWRDALIKED